MSKITKFCKIHNKWLTKNEKDFLTNYILITKNFYGLPKIHNSKQIKPPKSEYIEIPNPSDLKFRPIVAGPPCPSNRHSRLIDILLQSFQHKIKTYIRENIDFLNFIPKKNYSNTLIITFHVTNLCSNIAHELRKQAISFWIDKYPDSFHLRFNKKKYYRG